MKLPYNFFEELKMIFSKDVLIRKKDKVPKLLVVTLNEKI